MAKKSTKQVSWRTLARRAKTAGPRKAKQLRQQAAALRRASTASTTSRGRKSWATRRRNAAVAKAHTERVVSQARADGERSLLDASTQMATPQPHGAPGHGEIVGGADQRLAEKLVKLARSRKGGVEAVQAEIMALRMQAGHDRAMVIDKQATKRLVDSHHAIADRIVCGFLAEVDMAQKTYRGLPPAMVWTLNSFTIIKIVDALNKAGYTAAGKERIAG